MKKALETVKFSLLVSLLTVRLCERALMAFCSKKRAILWQEKGCFLGILWKEKSVLATFCGNERLLCGYSVTSKDCFGGILWQEKGCFVGSDNLYLFGECVCIYCVSGPCYQRGETLSVDSLFTFPIHQSNPYISTYLRTYLKRLCHDILDLYFFMNRNHLGP